MSTPQALSDLILDNSWQGEEWRIATLGCFMTDAGAIINFGRLKLFAYFPKHVLNESLYDYDEEKRRHLRH